MRSLLFSLFTLATLGCGRAALPDEPLEAPAQSAPPARAGRVRLTVGAQSFDGFRFADQKLINTRFFWSDGKDRVEQRASDGTLLSAGEASTDLQLMLNRSVSLRTDDAQLCTVPALTASLDEVDAAVCDSWTTALYLPLADDTAGVGLVLRRSNAGLVRLWVAQSGYDTEAKQWFITFDYSLEPSAGAAGTGPVCSGDQGPCVIRDHCCNSRHSCIAERCQY